MRRNEKRLYIHCGLHKTGTTSLQVFLRNNVEALLNAGILYPCVGCLDSVGSGHHNIAWQIARDRRFDRALGDIEALAREIGNFSGDVLLSSEDFECSLGSPSAFAPLVRYAISTQREVVIVIYVRNQISYLESLYCEMLGHGFGEEYQVIAEQVIERKRCLMREWAFHFDYLQIPRRLISVPKLRFVFRNFHTLRKNSISADFASILRIDPALADKAFNFRSNERDVPTTSLSLFYQNRISRPLNATEIDVIEHLCRLKKGQINTGNALRNLFIRTFLKTNRHFCRKHNVPEEGLVFDSFNHDSTAVLVRFERFFSFETQCAIREIAALKACADLSDDKQTAAIAVAEDAIEAWWTDRPSNIP
jgi:hypothetical protein